jgi:hypothetical protein
MLVKVQEPTGVKSIKITEAANGLSAYQVAVKNGFVGDEAAWEESLKVKGDEGKSAYEVAVDEGFIGTKAEWLDSLNGADGTNGTDGTDGADGYTPVKGVDYFDGDKGDTGAKGDIAIQGEYVSYSTLAAAQAVNPKPTNGTMFHVEEASKKGVYTFQSGEAGGTRFERGYLSKEEIQGLLPINTVSANSFTENKDFTAVFNTGTITLDVNRVLYSPASWGGIYLGKDDLITGNEYEVTIDITNISAAGIRFAERWGGTQYSNLANGVHKFKFIAGSGGVNKPVVATTSSGGDFYLNSFDISLINNTSKVASKNDLSDKISAFPVVLSNDYTVDSNGILAFNGGTFSYDATNSRIAVNPSGGTRGVYLTSSTVENKMYLVKVNVTLTGNKQGFEFISTYNINEGKLKNGDNYFVYKAGSGNGFNAYPIIINKDSTDTHYINSTNIYEISYSIFEYLINGIRKNKNIISTGEHTTIGESITHLETSSFPIVAVGKNVKALTVGSTAIGGNASTEYSNTYDPTANSNGECVAIGMDSKATSWRTVSIGNKSIAASTSSTAIGFGAVVAKTHGVAIGRGAYLPDNTIIEINPTLIGGSGSHDFYLSNAWGHRFKVPPSGISIGGYVPSNVTKRYHGQDAYDELDGTDVNIEGGHAAISGGRGTGTGKGGKVKIETAPATGSKTGNQKNDLVSAAEFDASTNVADSTRFLLYDISAGTLKRVKIAAAGTAPNGVGKALYID